MNGTLEGINLIPAKSVHISIYSTQSQEANMIEEEMRENVEVLCGRELTGSPGRSSLNLREKYTITRHHL